MKHFNIRAAIASLFSGSGRNNRNGLPEKTDFSDEDARYMRMAIDLSVENIDNGGGPFGAVIVRDGEVIATGVNRAIDFDDSFIYDQLDLEYDQRSIRCEHFLRDEAQKAFRKWQEKSDKIPY